MQVPNPLAPFVSGSAASVPPPAAGPASDPFSPEAETARPVTAAANGERSNNDTDPRSRESDEPPPRGVLLDISV